jgi:hypothetical protein
MLASGERPITGVTGDGGTRARVVEITGSPFGTADQATADIVRQLQCALQEHFGHAGPIFVAWLLAHRTQWEQFRQRFRDLRSALTEHAGNKPLGMRLCDPLAAICLAEELAHVALGLPAAKMRDLCIGLLAQITEIDQPAEALRHVHAWATAHQDQFFGGGVRGASQSARHEIVDRWDQPDWEWIGFLPQCLKRVLEQGGYEFDAILPSWDERSWLLREHEANGTVRRTVKKLVGSNKNARVIAIRRSAIELVDPSGPEESDELDQPGLDEEREPERGDNAVAEAESDAPEEDESQVTSNQQVDCQDRAA